MSIKSILERMTLREKVGQLASPMHGWRAYEKKGDEIVLTDEFKHWIDWFGGMGHINNFLRADPWSGRCYDNGLTAADKAKAVNLMQDYIQEHTRLKIPVYVGDDSPHGHLSLDSTTFPTNIAMGCSFDRTLYRRVMECIAKEVKCAGGNTAYISLFDLLQDPRWGRSEECIGEDPYLQGEFCVAAVEGIQAHGVSITAKHYCAQGAAEGGHNGGAVKIGERELREIHLQGVKKAVAAGADIVMAAYNDVDGVQMHANRYLLTDVLRGEFGFDGVVMADGCGVDKLRDFSGSYERAGAIAVDAGVDWGLWDTAFTKLEEAVKEGYISEEIIDRAVERVLSLKKKRGMLTYEPIAENRLTEYLATGESRRCAYDMACESTVLLKNDGVLPFKDIKKLAVIGPNAHSVYNMLGDYTAEKKVGAVETVYEAIQKGNPNVATTYARGCGFDGDTSGINAAVEAARDSDAVVLVLGGSSARAQDAATLHTGAVDVDGLQGFMDCGEGVDCASLELSGAQNELTERLYQTGKPLTVVLIQGRPYCVTDVVEKASALVCAWYCGDEGGRAISDILYGRVNPSGKLSVSFPRSAGQLPVYYNHRTWGRGAYCDVGGEPLFKFGHGLSYATFRYENLRVSGGGTDFTVRVDIENVSKMDGKEIAMLFIRRIDSSLTARVAELKGFEKIFLRAGQKKTVTLRLCREELQVWSARRQFEIEDGRIEISVGTNLDECLRTLIEVKELAQTEGSGI